MTQVTELDYKQAQQGDVKVRQEFLNAIDLEEATEFVSEVKYNPEDRLVRAHFLATLGDFDLPMLGSCKTSEKFVDDIYDFFSLRKKRSTLFAYPYLFKQSYSIFCSTLIDHEGQHARQDHQRFRQGKKLWKLRDNSSYEQEPYFVSLVEIPAVANQIVMAEKRGLTDKELEQIHLRYRGHLQNLILLSGNKNSINDLMAILCDSRGDKFVENLVIEELKWNC